MSTALEVYKNSTKEELIRKVEELEKFKNSVAKLGDGTVFVKRDKRGILESVKAMIHLREDNNEILKINNKYMVTVGGVAKLNQVPGLNVITPPEVIVDGRPVSNPYIERNPKTKVIQSVYVRKLVFGHNPIGNVVGLDYTLFFNIYTYFIQDLQAKIKKYPACGVLGLANERPQQFISKKLVWKKTKTGKSYQTEGNEEIKTDVSDKMLKFVEIEDGVGLWIDLGHPEIRDCYNTHVQRQKFGDRHAQSICERNAILKHPAIAAKLIRVENGVAAVPVYGFRHEMDPVKVSEMADAIARGRTKDLEEEGVVIDITQKDASFEEVSLSDEGDEFGNIPESESGDPVEEESKRDGVLELDPEGGTKDPKDPGPSKDSVLFKIQGYEDALGTKKFNAIMKELKITNLSDLTVTELLNVEKVALRPAVDSL